MADPTLDEATRWKRIAGVCLETPRARHELPSSAGPIAMEREHSAWRSGTSFRLSVQDISVLVHGSSFDSPEHLAHADHWRALIVEHHLFSSPAWLLDDTSTLPDGPQQALASLRAEALEILSLSRHGAVACDACIRKARESFRASQARSLQGSSFSVKCSHVALLTRAVRRLCKQFPTILFELLGWIRPEHPPAGGEPRRFVLSEQVASAVLSSWLLGKVSLASYHYGGWLEDRLRRSRDVVRGSWRRFDDWGDTPDDLRGATSFSSQAWLFDAPPPSLLRRLSPGEQAPSAPHFPRAPRPVEVEMLAPDLDARNPAPSQAPAKTKATRKTRK